MISKKLKERTFLIKGTPLPDRAKDSFANRRDAKGIVMVSSEDESDKYDTFFDYEADLANLKASGEQYADMVISDPYVILEEREETPNKGYDVDEEPIVMEPLLNHDSQRDSNYKDVVGFDFIQCSYLKSDGNRCKRQAPKGQEICSVHRKHIAKHGY